MERRWVLLIVFGLLALILPRFILPPLVSTHMERALQGEFAVEIVDVKLDSNWGWELLWGRVTRVQVTGRHWRLGSLPVENLEAEATNVSIDSVRLLRYGDFVYHGAESLAATIVVSEDDLNMFFRQQEYANDALQIELTADGAMLTGSISVLGSEITMRLQGTLAIGDESQLLFVPQELAVADTRVPRLLLELIRERYGMLLDFGHLPIPMRLDRLEVTDDRLLIYGSEMR